MKIININYSKKHTEKSKLTSKQIGKLLIRNSVFVMLLFRCFLVWAIFIWIPISPIPWKAVPRRWVIHLFQITLLLDKLSQNSFNVQQCALHFDSYSSYLFIYLVYISNNIVFVVIVTKIFFFCSCISY